MNHRTFLAAITLALLVVPSTAFAAGDAHAGFPWAVWAASIFNLLVFLGLLRWKLWPVLQDYFAARSESLSADVKEARELRIKAQAALDDYTARLEKLDDERTALMDEYHQAGAREKERIIADAKRQVEKMRADAEVVIAQEVRRAVAAIEQQAVDLAVDMARQAITAKVDDGVQSTLVDRYVDELKMTEA